MKKVYVIPDCNIGVMYSSTLLNSVSLSPDGKDNVGVILGGEGDTHNGEFNSKKDIWSDD